MLAPKGALEIHEEAWNCYPYNKTVLTVSDPIMIGANLITITINDVVLSRL